MLLTEKNVVPLKNSRLAIPLTSPPNSTIMPSIASIVLAERETHDSFNYRLIVNLKASFHPTGYTQQNKLAWMSMRDFPRGANS